MDHIPRPLNPIHPVVEVPLLSLEPYDGGDLLTYPERQGWGARSVADWERLFSQPTGAFCAFLQRWFYFGFLECFLGARIDPCDFARRQLGVISPDVPAYLLTSVHLPLIIGRHTSNFRRDFRRIINSSVWHVIEIHAILGQIPWKWDEARIQPSHEELARHLHLTTFIYTSFSRVQDPRDPRIAASISLLIETLTISVIQNLEPAKLGLYLESTLSGFTWTRLRRDGWCPSQLVPIFAHFGPSCLSFISNLERPHPTEEHPMFHVRPYVEQIRCKDEQQSPIDTIICSTTQCRYRTIQQSTYRTKHVNEGCCCVDVHADPNEIAKILKNGNIPLISSINQTKQSPKIKLVESDPALAYVAMSHVWADGLGNLKENALPHCQLLRLSNLIRALPGESSNIVLFWMDTICVPPDGTGQNEAQELAMQLMRQTYENAAAVLVFDHWLLESPGSGRSDVENLMRIYCSLWNSRLWTFQEGILAKRLYFQFANLAYNLDHAALRIRSSNNLEPSLKYNLETRYSDLRGFKLRNMSMTKRLLAITRTLVFRSTSVASDEALCLATLLDLDMARILRCPSEKRMEEFWKVLPVIPAEMLGLNVERLDTEGLRWAPCSLMQHELEGITENTKARGPPPCLLSSGLLLQSLGIVFRTFDNPLGISLALLDEEDFWVHLSFEMHKSSGGIPYMHDPDGLHAVTALCINPVGKYHSDRMAYLFHTFNSNARPRHASGLLSEGFLVVITNEEDGVFYARQIGRAWHRRQVPGLNDNAIYQLNQIERTPEFVMDGWVRDRRNGILGATRGVTTSLTQQWCID